MALATKVVAKSMLRSRAGRGPQGKRGFTLVEVLIVLVILGIMLTIAGIEVMRTLQKGRLTTAAQALELTASRAYLEAQRRGATVFLRVGPVATGVMPVELWADNITNDPGNDHVGTLKTTNPFADILVERLTYDTAQICFSTVNAGQVESTAWSENDTDATKSRVLACDTFGRAMDVSLVPPLQLAQTATLSITHARMVSGRLLPKRNHQLRISPAWGVQIAEVPY